MSVREIQKVDLVTRKDGIYYLYIYIDDEELEETDIFLESLKAKVNNYATYFLNGQMLFNYPDLNQDRMTVRISTTKKMPTGVSDFFDRLRDAMKPYKIDLEAEVI
jgi:hypothetical protein